MLSLAMVSTRKISWLASGCTHRKVLSGFPHGVDDDFVGGCLGFLFGEQAHESLILPVVCDTLALA